LSGYARTGKDEVANILVEEHGFKRIAFADKLRDMLYALNPIVQADFGFEFERKWDGPAFIMLQEAIDTYGWSNYKESVFGTEIRRLLQRLGTEAGRKTMWDSIWIDAALKDIEGRVVVTDGRFYNEFDAVRERGGVVWRIERPGIGALNDHASETEAIDYPHFRNYIINDGSLDDLKIMVGVLCE
jgi:hypothetical protein